MQDKFRTKRGWLTHYALACGYIERTFIESNECSITLEFDSVSYAVKAYNHMQHVRLAWKNFGSLLAARAEYRKLCKYIASNDFNKLLGASHE